MPNMREARYYFNPCMYFGVIYICGYGSCLMEAFSLQPQEQFVPNFNITLPENRACCVYVADNLLVVHSFSWILKYKPGRNNQLLEEDSRKQFAAWADKYQNTLPVLNLVKKQIYMSYNNSCYIVNMESGLKVNTIS